MEIFISKLQISVRVEMSHTQISQSQRAHTTGKKILSSFLFVVVMFLHDLSVTSTLHCIFNRMAPEVVSSSHYSAQADVFSFGIILWELLTSRVPERSLSEVQVCVLLFLFKKISTGYEL